MNETEEPVALIGDARGKEQMVALAVVCATRAKLKSPETVDGERIALGIDQRRVELTTVEVEGVDPAVTEITYEQMSPKFSKALGRERQTPRRVQRSM